MVCAWPRSAAVAPRDVLAAGVADHAARALRQAAAALVAVFLAGLRRVEESGSAAGVVARDKPGAPAIGAVNAIRLAARLGTCHGPLLAVSVREHGDNLVAAVMGDVGRPA